MKTKYIIVIFAVAVIGAIAASYVIASVVNDLIMSPFSESVNNLAGEFHTALSYLNTTGVAKLTTEEKSFVGSWWLIANTTNETRILSNWSFYYDRTYSQTNQGNNTSSGTWSLRKHTIMFSRQHEGVIIDQPDDGGEVYWWFMLQPTTNSNTYNVTSFGRLYSSGKTEVLQFNQIGFTSMVVSRIGAS